MNRNENKSIISMEKDELKNLVKEVKETIAKDVDESKNVFSAADLWHIQKSRRTATGLSKKWEHNH